MPAECLSISIPTRNRSHLLRDLLSSLAAGIKAANLSPEDVRVYVSDNASTDATKAVAHEIMGALPHFIYWCNEQNVGARKNILACASKPAGEYRWIIGDDEVLPVETLPFLLSHLREHRPGWFIHSDGKFSSALNPPRSFAEVGEFLRAATAAAPGLLIIGGTISLNTFRHDCFDHALAQSLEPTSNYAHFFGLMNGLRCTKAPVYLTNRPTVIFREQRPAPADGELPDNSDANWRECMSWLKEQFQLEQLDAEIQSRLVSQEYIQQAFRHPWRTLRNNAALFLIPATYPRIVKRLWFAIKR
jgi:glycosyltransferase involved in cell wall biosynthesis